MLNDREIINLYKSGLGSTKIGKLFNIPRHTVIYRLKKNKIELTPFRNRVYTDDKFICMLYNQGKSLLEIAEKFFISGATVRNRLIKNRIKIRKTGPKRQIQINDLVFNEFNDSSCYWAGFFAADGCVYGNEISLHLHSKDKNHIEKFGEFLYTDVQVKKSANQNSHYIKFRSDRIAADLENNFNIIPCKSLVLQPPQKMPDGLVRHYIRGYFDGDGSIWYSKNKKAIQIEICSGSKDFLEWVNSYIRKFSNITVRQRSNKNLFRIGTTGKSIPKIMDWLYKDCGNNFLERKKQKYHNFIGG
jgi:DNA-binding CsgD family transcriptional regulator